MIKLGTPRGELGRSADRGDSVEALRPRGGKLQEWATCHDLAEYLRHLRAASGVDAAAATSGADTAAMEAAATAAARAKAEAVVAALFRPTATHGSYVVAT